MTKTSYLAYLECSNCGRTYPVDEIQTFCLDCQAPLLPRYEMESARKSLDRAGFQKRPKGMWRWHELLPVFEAGNRITLGEGDTPLLQLTRLGAELGLKQLYVKDESLNPTGSFYSANFGRVTSAAAPRQIQLGAKFYF